MSDDSRASTSSVQPGEARSVLVMPLDNDCDDMPMEGLSGGSDHKRGDAERIAQSMQLSSFKWLSQEKEYEVSKCS